MTNLLLAKTPKPSGSTWIGFLTGNKPPVQPVLTSWE